MTLELVDDVTTNNDIHECILYIVGNLTMSSGFVSTASPQTNTVYRSISKVLSADLKEDRRVKTLKMTASSGSTRDLYPSFTKGAEERYSQTCGSYLVIIT